MTALAKAIRAAADTLEAGADAGEPLQPFDMAMLAITLRDWALEIEMDAAVQHAPATVTRLPVRLVPREGE